MNAALTKFFALSLLFWLTSFARASERLEADQDVGIFRFYPYKLDNVFIEFDRNLDQQNLYTVRIVYDTSFRVKVQSYPAKETILEQRLSMVFPYRVSLLAVPSASIIEEGDFGRPDSLEVFARHQQSTLLPFLVRLEGEAAERLLLFDPATTHALTLLDTTPTSAAAQAKVLAGLRKGTLEKTKIRGLLDDAVGEVMRTPTQSMIQEQYFKMREREFHDREVRRVEVAAELEALRQRLLTDRAADWEYERFVAILNANYPVDYNYLDRSELKSFSLRFVYDYRLMAKFSMPSFIKYYKFAAPRVHALVEGLDHREHAALPADKLQAVMLMLPEGDPLLETALELASIKHFDNNSVSASVLETCKNLVARAAL